MPDRRHTKKTKARVPQGPRLSFEDYLDRYRNREAVREERAEPRRACQRKKTIRKRRLTFLKLSKG